MRIFKIIISSLFLILVLSVFGNIIISTIGLFFNHDIIYSGVNTSDDISINARLIFIFKAIALLIFIAGVFVLITKLNFLVKRDFFNQKLIVGFSKSGTLFSISGVIGFLISIIEIYNYVVLKDYNSQTYLSIDSKGLYVMLMILGLFFILFSKVLNKGNQIQQENDLTI